MKKNTALLLAIIFILAVFAGCSAVGHDTEASDNATSEESYATQDSVSATEDTMEAVSENSSIVAEKNSDFTEKLIYTAYAEIETTEFDKTIDDVYSLIDKYGAFIESSSVSGANYSSAYYNHQTYRHANFTIRVPVDSFKAMKADMDSLGNVLYINTDVDNITPQYTDTESRLNAYRAEEENLMEMLEMAETVEDMITIQDRLSEVRYNIETLTSTLRNWQNQVDYSTIELQINEVEDLTEKFDIQQSYWEQMWSGFKSTLNDIGEFFKECFKGFVIILPVLLLLVIIAFVILLIIRLFIKRGKNKKKKIESIQPEVTDDKKE